MRDEKPPKRAAFLYARRGNMEGASPSGHSAGCGVSDAPPRELADRPGGAKDAWRHLGMYSFQIERIHPPDPRRKIQGGFRISPLTTPLKRPKEGLRPFLWEPSWGLRGIGGCGPAGDQGCGRFAARLRGTLGRGSGTPSRRALRKVYRSSGSGPMYLRHGFRRPNFVPKFGASVIGIGPYGTRRGAAASAGAAL